MITFLLRRLLLTIPVIFGVLTLTFFLIHLIPGDPVDLMLGEQASHQDKEVLRTELGLNLPLKVQYKNFLGNAIHLNFGVSLTNQKPVFEEIAKRVPATLQLTLAAMAFALLVGIPLGVLAATRQYHWVDHAILIIGLIGISLPGFFLGPLLIWIFAIHWDLLPVSERTGLDSLILPAVSLGVALSSILIRMTRASMLDVIREDYVRTARAKGLPEKIVFFKHALRNALMPVITVIGLQFGALLTGTVVTETIFDWPGVGTLFFQAIQQRNYPLVQGCVLFVSLTYVFVNLLTDIAYAVVNPRIRLS